MELAPGVMVADHIRLVRLIGEGGMGTVWEAEHEKLNASVALKILSREAASQSRSMVARFKREGHAAGRIQSPHVVQIFDSGELYDGTPYLSMELLDGRDMGEEIERTGPMDLATVNLIIGQVAKALGKAHEAGVVHRDVKPENVFLTDEDGDTFVKVLDFGIAKQFDVQSHSVVTMTGAMVGTPAYMSPEQVLTGKDVDARSDIWSLGVLTYYALCGDIPFGGDTLGAMCVAIAGGQFKPVTEQRPELPPALDGWFARTLAVPPADRFGSARDAADALERASSGIPPSVGQRERVSRTIVMTESDVFADAETSRATQVLARPVPTFTTSVHLPMAGPSPRVVWGVGAAVLLVGLAIATPIWLSSRRDDDQATGAETAPEAEGPEAPRPTAASATPSSSQHAVGPPGENGSDTPADTAPSSTASAPDRKAPPPGSQVGSRPGPTSRPVTAPAPGPSPPAGSRPPPRPLSGPKDRGF